MAKEIAYARIIFARSIRMAMVVGSGGIAGSRTFSGIERAFEVLLANISIHAVQKRSVDGAREKAWAGIARERIRRVWFGVT